MRFQNKKAVITGGTTGIGLATARQYLAEGAEVIVTGTNPTNIAAAQKELGAKALVVKSSQSDLADIDQLAATIKEKFGMIDALFVNAGIAKFIPYQMVTPEFYDETMSINLRGAFFTVQKLAPLMNRGGGIVLNTSVVDEKGMATTSVYAASKSGLRSLARTLGAELAGSGVRVNAVSPGPIETPIYGKLGMSADQLAGFQKGMAASNPMKRFGSADEVAKAVLFLTSSDASYTTGAELTVDGGFVQM